ncbi:MAG TPA: TetR/AcrR family transcriptional regulator [Acidimicrobiales bacterium]|nr:TetR/AcrR family transcriptional regulator [Acidimicrobiales bacterium]
MSSTDAVPTSAPRTARARARAELTAEITNAARRQLTEVGAAALSLRAVARELGMASSAVYRYFPSRDELLTALIVDAYDAVGAAAEAAERDTDGQPTVARWGALATAVRAWASGHPNEYALIYGSPVPGYAAPPDTIDPAARPALAFLRVVADGMARGEIDAGEGSPRPPVLAGDLGGIRDAGAPGVPDEVVARALLVWTQLFGMISFELFGHLHNVVHDYDALFDELVARTGAYLVGQDSSRSSGGRKS